MRPRSCASEARSETNCARSIGGKTFRISPPSRATTGLVPVENTCDTASDRPWLRAMSRAIGSQREDSERHARNASKSASFGSTASRIQRDRTSAIRARAFELAQQLVAALDGGIHRSLRRLDRKSVV